VVLTFLENEMDRFVVLVFAGATALIVDGEPLICDGCTDELEVENWAAEKFSAGREVYTVVMQASEAAAVAYIARFGYELVEE
jgi:hypothetical protein